MVVFILERVSPGLRGELTRWMLEPKAGVFLGRLSGMVRDRLWEKIGSRKGDRGAALMIFSADTEQGYDFRILGDTSRLVEDFDGLKLVCLPKPREGKLES